MTISQSDLLGARLSNRYRLGIWLARLGNVIYLPLVVWSILDESRSEFLLVGAAIFVATVWPAGWLMFAALLRVHRGPLQTLDPAAGKAVLRDLFFPKPRA